MLFLIIVDFINTPGPRELSPGAQQNILYNILSYNIWPRLCRSRSIRGGHKHQPYCFTLLHFTSLHFFFVPYTYIIAKFLILAIGNKGLFYHNNFVLVISNPSAKKSVPYLSATTRVIFTFNIFCILSIQFILFYLVSFPAVIFAGKF